MSEEAKLQVGKDLLTSAQLSRHLAETYLADQDWSGVPVPVAGLKLVLEPRYKYGALSEFRWKECYDEDGVRYALDATVFMKLRDWKSLTGLGSNRNGLAANRFARGSSTVPQS